MNRFPFQAACKTKVILVLRRVQYSFPPMSLKYLVNNVSSCNMMIYERNYFTRKMNIEHSLGTQRCNQTWGNYQLVNYFLPISHYNWQWKVICQFNESISFNSTSFDQLVCQLLLILLLLMYSNSNLMGLINQFLLVLVFRLLALYL